LYDNNIEDEGKRVLRAWADKKYIKIDL